ncbi:protein mono-ADP-ribosyltransferase PARP12 [Cololabis saira]|uniref:protein mono-ADP-ribosyltransferase PARP12 n=1 Tax=Cololabis saira TaxID=129043 RepID=UPI002AD22A0A|nr:protein mono-ADP-ribosyltransferase PARP12 [Cololabis saira]
MTSNLSKLITKILCDHEGCLDLQELKQKLQQSRVRVDASELGSVLRDDGRIALRPGRVQAGPGQDQLVVGKSSLRLCRSKPGDCLQCDDLHLCRFHVCGGCTFGPKCKNQHNLATPHNAGLLRRNGLNDLTEKQLFLLLLQNDPSLLPEVCPHYNKGDGDFGSCKFTTSCTKLHVCQHFLQGDCKFGPSCKRVHTINVTGMKLFQRFSQENIRSLEKIYRNKFIIMDKQGSRNAAVVPDVNRDTPQPFCQPPHNNPASPTKSVCASKPMTDAEKNEICLFFLRRHCSFKEKCARVHWHLPYRWQVLEKDGVTWMDLPKMDDIEKAYCDPACDTSRMDEPLPTTTLMKLLSLQRFVPSTEEYVDFNTMTYGGSPVRRISSPSSITKPPHFILTTEWVWYWQDENGLWEKYGQGDATVTSPTLENLYLADKDTDIPFQAGKHQYVLQFKDAAGTQRMYQQNVKYKTKREVRRRPRFVSAQEIETTLKSASTPSSSSSAPESFPSYWDKTALPDFGHKLVLLSKSAMDYNMIEKLFKTTMPRSKIHTIERIQNPFLWRFFEWQKKEMQQKNGGKLVDQKYLFHGTEETLIEPICSQNFDWRMCGVHGTTYGKGSYFARDASYSDRYCSGGSHKTMFVALVLVGEYTKGKNSYVRPPPKGSVFYNSCVDNESNPSIYVIFEKNQIYPEYIIKYN